MHDALRTIFRESVIGISAAFDRIESRIDIVPRWRTHRGRLEAMRKSYPLACQPINVWCVRLTTVTAEITKGAIVGNDEEQVGCGLCGSVCRSARAKKRNKDKSCRQPKHETPRSLCKST